MLPSGRLARPRTRQIIRTCSKAPSRLGRPAWVLALASSLSVCAGEPEPLDGGGHDDAVEVSQEDAECRDDSASPCGAAPEGMRCVPGGWRIVGTGDTTRAV